MSRKWGRVPFLSSSADEEMGKKDDDRKPGSRATWAPSRITPRPTAARRFLPIVFAIGLLYLYFSWLRSDDLSIPGEYNPIFPSYGTRDPPSKRPLSNIYPPSRTPSRPQKQEKGSSKKTGVPARTFNGDFSFVLLARTLRQVSSSTGHGEASRNVLFASSSAKSAAALLPLACEMAKERRNYVHYAILSRNEQPIKAMMRLNGIDDSCGIIFHDARPDRAAESADMRAETSAERAFYYLESYLHPQAVIIDTADDEEPTFTEALRHYRKGSQLSVAELPRNGAQRFPWLAKLDGSSLSAWSKVDLEIVITAPRTGSGSLIRLLRSLSDADFSPFPTSHLTIELPHDIEKPTLEFLGGFSWPPKRGEARSGAQMLSLRRRLSRQPVDERQSIERFLESAWPHSLEYSHVLILSPQAQLSSSFVHYLKYALLEYRYSAAAIRQHWDQRLVGLSLDFPSTYLNATDPFEPPRPLTESELSPSDGTPFLWQAPSSSAMLILGDKWRELHNFVALGHETRDAAQNPPLLLTEKNVSKAFPAWLEALLQLSRLRGYFTLYPSAETASTLAVVHEDLFHLPEEYSADKDSEALRAKLKSGPSRRKEDPLISHSSLNAMHTLPQGSLLLPFRSLPFLDWEGNARPLSELDEDASEYAYEFKRTAGKCSDTDLANGKPDSSTKDLFCWTK